MKAVFFYIGLISLSIFSACSKEDEMGAGDNDQLTASAGSDLSVQVGWPVGLSGAGSSDAAGSALEFSWRFISKPVSSAAQLEDSDTDSPNFTADAQGKYKIELTVSNTSQHSAADTVTVAAFKVREVEGEYENMFPGPNVGIRDFTIYFDCLIATCEFTEIGGIEAKKIACFNGSIWSALGCGLEEGSIYDMITYKGELYVTGQFEEIGCIEASNIARWNGEEWQDVEGGLTGGDDPFGDALAVYENELYVGGRFAQAGDVNAVNIAKWDGEEWSAVGIIENGSVRELEVYKQKLYVGGFFDSVNGNHTGSIAAYDGSNWNALGSMENLELQSTGAVKHMAVFNDELYISGDFSWGDADVSELIVWDGSGFMDFGRTFSTNQGVTISELTVINDVLYIGGTIPRAASSEQNNILQWDGESWGSMGEGTSGPVLAIVEYKGKIYIGGDFEEAGGETAEKISIWTED